MEEEGESGRMFFAIVIGLIILLPNIPTGPPDAIINPFSCTKIEGSVIFKEYDEEGHKLYVELFIQSEWEGHIVFVSNNTYNSFEVGDTYERIICDLIEYENILQQYEDYKNIGILIPHNG
tara:strand:+ start:676 stop:1038 length:363 start_codon:yes stop_codon:yes gene_type:complete